MKTTRRITLAAMLGLVASGKAIGVETFGTEAEPGDKFLRTGVDAFQTERFAWAFEAIAAGIRDGSLEVESLNIESKFAADQIVDLHKLVLAFRYPPEGRV